MLSARSIFKRAQQFTSSLWRSSSVNVVSGQCKHTKPKIKASLVTDLNMPVLPSNVNRISKCTFLFELNSADILFASDYLQKCDNRKLKGLLQPNSLLCAAIPTNRASIRSFFVKGATTYPGAKKKIGIFKRQLSQLHNMYSKKKQISKKDHLVIVTLLVISFTLTYWLLNINEMFWFRWSVEDSSTRSTVTFDDIQGHDEIKSELDDVVEFLKDPQKYTEIGAKLPKGILLVGLPGTGETLLAKAVAGEAGASFFCASGNIFKYTVYNLGYFTVQHLFEKAKKQAPAIIFLGNIDACKENGSVSRLACNQLLLEMDRLTENDAVVVLAATKNVEVLYKALKRPGRFDTQVKVSKLVIQGERVILDDHFLVM